MLKWFSSPILAFPIVSVALSSCALFAPSGPSDLKLVSLDFQSPEVRTRLKQKGGFPSRDEFRVTFSSEIDLMSLSYRHDFNIYNEVMLGCARPEDMSRAEEPSNLERDENVYRSNFNVSSLYRTDGPADSFVSEEKPIVYEVYFLPSMAGPRPDETAVILQEWKHHRGNVCLQVRGGDIFGGHFESNTLMLSPEALTTAIDKRKEL